jgi:hypothetical protein
MEIELVQEAIQHIQLRIGEARKEGKQPHWSKRDIWAARCLIATTEQLMAESNMLPALHKIIEIPLGDNADWSRDHDVCIECETTERKHRAHGLCTLCYQRIHKNNKVWT